MHAVDLGLVQIETRCCTEYVDIRVKAVLIVEPVSTTDQTSEVVVE